MFKNLKFRPGKVECKLETHKVIWIFQLIPQTTFDRLKHMNIEISVALKKTSRNNVMGILFPVYKKHF